MRQTAISFPSEKLTLEGVVGWPQGTSGRVPAVVVCPPHPTLSGDMEHPLVLALCAALDRRGFATVRFNFRGVGKSEGDFTNGDSEIHDVAASLKLAAKWPGCDGKRLGLVGYSFAASLVLRDLDRVKSARALALVSPPPAAARSLSAFKGRQQTFVLVGDADRIAPADRLSEIVAGAEGRVDLQIVPDATHSWRGMEADAAVRVARFLGGALGSGLPG